MRILKEHVPGKVPDAVSLRNVRSSRPTGFMPTDFERSNCSASSPARRKIAMRSTASVRDSRSITEESSAFKSVSELSSRPNSISVRR